ncbi:MAG: Stp1/IreP family PP2C-type Ser/Thr phosphatase [Longimicrobiales bacterium]
MTFTFAGHTDVGRVRTRNEDALLQQPLRGLAAVADGMGGHAGGDVASRIAVDVLDDRTRDMGPDPGTTLAAAVREAHEAILRAARADPGLQGMGTTLTALWVQEEECIIAHVGDSRAYRWRDEELDQLTRDQTWVQEQVDTGALSREQARTHPFSSILTGALGIDDQELEIQVVEPGCEPGDTFLLCSDGLNARLADHEILDVLRANAGDLDAAAHALIDAANEAGGPDNITVALVRAE